MESLASLRYLRQSARKVRLVVDQIRGMKVEDAVAQLEVSTRAAARPLLKLLHSAIANATNNKNLTKETLRIKTMKVNEGPTLGRFRARAFGRAAAIRKRTSHVHLVLTGTPMSKKSRAARLATAVSKKDAANAPDMAVTPSKTPHVHAPQPAVSTKSSKPEESSTPTA